MNKEKEIETVTLMVRRYCWGVHGTRGEALGRRAMQCWNTPESGGTDACTGKFSGTLILSERHNGVSYYNCIGTVSFLTAVYASVPDGEAVRRICVRKEAAHAEYP